MSKRYEPPADRPTLADVKALIRTMSADDRAMLHPWILAKFDVRGNPNPGAPTDDD